MKKKLVLVAMGILALQGCASRKEKRPPPPPFEISATGAWYPQEGQLVAGQEGLMALLSVQGYERRQQRGGRIDYHYRIERDGDGYSVIVAYGAGFRDGEAVLTPGAQTTYQLDRTFQITNVRSGL